MKAVRTREENLDELKRRRKGVIAKADSAEKKLSRMSPEVCVLLLRIKDKHLLNRSIAQEPSTTDGTSEQPSAADTVFGLGNTNGRGEVGVLYPKFMDH